MQVQHAHHCRRSQCPAAAPRKPQQPRLRRPPLRCCAEAFMATTRNLDPAGSTVIFVLGGPGSGKGTQCAKIADKYGCKHLSTGDLLREEIDSSSELGQQVEQLMKEGQLVPEETVIGVVRQAMAKSGPGCFLIDGFPRELSHAHTFEEQVLPCRLVLSFDCPFETLEQRLQQRAKSSDRPDDNPETMRKRFDTFAQQSKPVIEHYTQQGNCAHISAVDGPDKGFERVVAVLDEVLKRQRRTRCWVLGNTLVPKLCDSHACCLLGNSG